MCSRWMQVDGQFAVFALLITTAFSTIFSILSIMCAYKDMFRQFRHPRSHYPTSKYSSFPVAGAGGPRTNLYWRSCGGPYVDGRLIMGPMKKHWDSWAIYTSVVAHNYCSSKGNTPVCGPLCGSLLWRNREEEKSYNNKVFKMILANTNT
jgi:hypothetical protein